MKIRKDVLYIAYSRKVFSRISVEILWRVIERNLLWHSFHQVANSASGQYNGIAIKSRKKTTSFRFLFVKLFCIYANIRRPLAIFVSKKRLAPNLVRNRADVDFPYRWTFHSASGEDWVSIIGWITRRCGYACGGVYHVAIIPSTAKRVKRFAYKTSNLLGYHDMHGRGGESLLLLWRVME